MKRNIPANFSSSKIKHQCICRNEENMKHIYLCKMLNSDEPTLEYEHIYTNNKENVIKVYERFVKNDKKREEILSDMRKDENMETDKLKMNLTMRSSCDPLYSG